MQSVSHKKVGFRYMFLVKCVVENWQGDALLRKTGAVRKPRLLIQVLTGGGKISRVGRDCPDV